MKLAQPIRSGAWILISLNLLMSFASVWIFVRMVPAIEKIIAENEASLEACEDMLTALTLADANALETQTSASAFSNALDRAIKNITEIEEPAVVERIKHSYAAALSGDRTAIRQTVEAISQLSKINRAALKRDHMKAKQLGTAGAWSIVFMSILIFLVGMINIHNIRVNAIDPLQEINSALTAFHLGDTLRRCSLKSPNRNVSQIFSQVNELMDLCSGGKAAEQLGKADKDDVRIA